MKHFDEPPDRNSLLYWYPEIHDYFETPETWVLSPPNLLNWLSNGIPKVWAARIRESLKKNYPVFFRTEHASNKHEWSKSCVIHHEEEIEGKILNTLYFNKEVGLWPEHLVFREMLRPYGGPRMKKMGGFQAFGGFPVSRELRFFVNLGRVECVHRYWAHEVFVLDRWAALTVPSDWGKRWKKLYTIDRLDIAEISGRIENDFSPLLKNDSWSVDFMYARQMHNPLYRWYLIDMAVAKDSYHFDHESDLISPGGKSVVLMNRKRERHEMKMQLKREREIVDLDFVPMV